MAETEEKKSAFVATLGALEKIGEVTELEFNLPDCALYDRKPEGAGSPQMIIRKTRDLHGFSRDCAAENLLVISVTKL